MPNERLLIKFYPLICPIFQESSKTGQLHDRAWIAIGPITRTNPAMSPMKALEQYVAAAHIDLSEDLPLFKSPF